MESAWVRLVWIIAYGVAPEEAAGKLVMEPCTDVCNVQANASMDIRCSLLNDAIAYSFQWYLFNGLKTIDMKNETNQNYIEKTGLSLLHYQASRAHHGWHLYCSAKTTNGDFESQKSTLNVFYPPQRPQFKVDAHVILDNHLNAIDGRKVVVECDVESNPPSEIIWDYNLKIVSKNKILVIHNVKQKDAGQYVCFARNTLTLQSKETSYGSNSNELHIEVLHPPTVPEVTYDGAIIDNLVVKVVHTRPNVFVCESYSKPNPSIHWQDCNNATVYSTRLELTAPKSGIITCVAENLMPELNDQTIIGRSQKSIYIDVLQSPSTPSCVINGNYPVFNKDKIALIKGTSFSLKCESLGNPVPAISLHTETSQLSAFGSINVQDINVATTRTFLCIAKNFMNPTFGLNGTGKSETSLTIEMLFPPTELVLSMGGSRLNNTTLSIKITNNVFIECTSDGYPPPTIRWEHGLNIYNGSFLTIMNVQETDGGTYICVVENTMTTTFGAETIGRSNLSILLIVQSDLSGSSQNSDLLFPLIGAGCGTFLLLAATVLVCVCSKRKMRENAVANKRNVALQERKRRKREGDYDDIVENPMYISADEALTHEPSTASQGDVVENPMYISADDIGRKKVGQKANAKGQVGQSEIYSLPYAVHKYATSKVLQYSSKLNVGTVVDEEDNHYAEIID